MDIEELNKKFQKLNNMVFIVLVIALTGTYIISLFIVGNISNLIILFSVVVVFLYWLLMRNMVFEENKEVDK